MLVRLLRLLRATGRNAVVLWHVCRHRGTPPVLKLATVLLVLYVLMPVDLIPDWIPFLGWIDDVTLLAVAIPAILRRVPPHVLQEAQTTSWSFPSRSRPQ